MSNSIENPTSILIDSSGVEKGTTGNPIKTDPTGTTTQPVSAASLPLPTGAATAALQTQPGVDIGDVTINNASGASAVNIQDGGNSITVDGPLTDAQLRAVAVPVSGTVTVNQGTFGGGASAWQTTITDTANAIVKPGDATNNAIRANIVASTTVPISITAQTAITGNLTALNTTVAISSVDSTSYGLSVMGTWVGTITPEFTIDGTNWFACRVVDRGTNDILQTITINENYYFYDIGGSVQLRVRMSAYTSGTANIVLSGTNLETKELLNYSGPDNDPAPPTRHISLATLTSVDSTLRAVRQGNVTPAGTEFMLLSRALAYGAGRSESQPETPASTSTGPAQVRVDPEGRAQVYASVMTNEGSFRDDFVAGALNARWTSSTTNGGTVDTPASSVVALTVPTTNAALASIYGAAPVADVGPVSTTFYASINNRRASQTILLGISELNSVSAPGACACFVFTGTVTNQVICRSSASNNAADIQNTTVTLPSGLNTSQTLRYKVDYSQVQVTFSISTGVQDDVIVARHQLHLPQCTTAVGPIAGILNTGATAGTTILSVDGCYFDNVNRLQVDSDFGGEPLPVRLPAAPITYSAATSPFVCTTSPGDVFLISGSSTKTIRVRQIQMLMTQTTAAVRVIFLIKRSTANSGGTAVTASKVPHDSSSAAATATVQHYTANPTTGTFVGNIRSAQVLVGTAAAASNNPSFFYDFTRGGDSQPIVLRGTAESLTINLNGVSSTGNSAICFVEWTEE